VFVARVLVARVFVSRAYTSWSSLAKSSWSLIVSSTLSPIVTAESCGPPLPSCSSWRPVWHVPLLGLGPFATPPPAVCVWGGGRGGWGHPPRTPSRQFRVLEGVWSHRADGALAQLHMQLPSSKSLGSLARESVHAARCTLHAVRCTFACNQARTLDHLLILLPIFCFTTFSPLFSPVNKEDSPLSDLSAPHLSSLCTKPRHRFATHNCRSNCHPQLSLGLELTPTLRSLGAISNTAPEAQSYTGERDTRGSCLGA
jgi:hypothetical protein